MKKINQKEEVKHLYALLLAKELAKGKSFEESKKSLNQKIKNKLNKSHKKN